MNTNTKYNVPVKVSLPSGKIVNALKNSQTVPGAILVSVILSGEVEPMQVHYTRITERK